LTIIPITGNQETTKPEILKAKQLIWMMSKGTDIDRPKGIFTDDRRQVISSEAGTFVVFKNCDYSNPIALSSLRNQFSTLLFPHVGPLTAAPRVQRVVQRSGFPASLHFDGFMECHVYSEASVPLE
jgi:hypothetical protein